MDNSISDEEDKILLNEYDEKIKKLNFLQEIKTQCLEHMDIFTSRMRHFNRKIFKSIY